MSVAAIGLSLANSPEMSALGPETAPTTPAPSEPYELQTIPTVSLGWAKKVRFGSETDPTTPVSSEPYEL